MSNENAVARSEQCGGTNQNAKKSLVRDLAIQLKTADQQIEVVDSQRVAAVRDRDRIVVTLLEALAEAGVDRPTIRTVAHYITEEDLPF